MDRFNGLDVLESLEDALDARTLAFVIYDVSADPALNGCANWHRVMRCSAGDSLPRTTLVNRSMGAM